MLLANREERSYSEVMENKMTELEAEICSRCGGTGRYSIGICFRCRGAKRTYTKRGAAARAFLERLRSKTFAEVVVGDKWYDDAPSEIPGFVKQWVLVTEIQTTPEHMTLVGVGLKTKEAHAFRGHAGTVVRIAQTAEQKTATFRAALEYQATLTKTGKVRKS